MKCILDGNTNSDPLSIPDPQKTLASTATTGLYEFADDEVKNAVSATLIFGGTDNTNETYKFRVDLAHRVENAGAGCYVWTPVAAGDVVLGALTYGTNGTSLGATGNLFADTIIDALSSERSLVFSPANDEIARLYLNVTGCVGIRVQIRRQDCASADVFCQLDDREVCSIACTKAASSVTGAATTATSSVTGTDTISASVSASKTVTATDDGTATPTKSDTASVSASVTATNTGTLTKSDTDSVSKTTTATDTKTATLTSSDTGSKTTTQSMSVSGTGTAPTFTATDTLTKSDTISASLTKSVTATDTKTLTKTDTVSASATSTSTGTVTLTKSDTTSVSASKTKTATKTGTATLTVTMTADSD